MDSHVAFNRIGGIEMIKLISRQFNEHAKDDTKLSKYCSLLRKKDPKLSKKLVVNFLCHATDGPPAYSDCETFNLIINLNITKQDWEHAISLLRKSVMNLNIETEVIDEIFTFMYVKQSILCITAKSNE